MRIVAYVKRQESSDLSVNELRQQLAVVMPDYMIPSMFIYLNKLPVGANGKLDQKALPSPDCSRPKLDSPFVEPRTATEKLLCQLWSKVLNIESVGARDNFLELGGESLAVFRLIWEIKNKFEMDIDPKTIFNTPMARIWPAVSMNSSSAREREKVLAT